MSRKPARTYVYRFLSDILTKVCEIELHTLILTLIHSGDRLSPRHYMFYIWMWCHVGQAQTETTKLKLNSIIFDTVNDQWNREWEGFIGILKFGPDGSRNIFLKNEFLLILAPPNFLTFHRACINTSCHYIYGSLFSIQ